jgi:hypothetical protein
MKFAEEQELYRKQLATIHHDDLLQEGLVEKGIEKVAINGLREGLHVELLQKLTGLSIDEIQSLKKRLNL